MSFGTTVTDAPCCHARRTLRTPVPLTYPRQGRSSGRRCTPLFPGTTVLGGSALPPVTTALLPCLLFLWEARAQCLCAHHALLYALNWRRWRHKACGLMKMGAPPLPRPMTDPVSSGTSKRHWLVILAGRATQEGCGQMQHLALFLQWHVPSPVQGLRGRR